MAIMHSKDWKDKDKVLQELRYHGYELKLASKQLRADKEVVLIAVKSWRNGN